MNRSIVALFVVACAVVPCLARDGFPALNEEFLDLGASSNNTRKTEPSYGDVDFDRNESAQALFAIARKYGYGEDVPVRFEEGFNTLPFFIPQWKAHG